VAHPGWCGCRADGAVPSAWRRGRGDAVRMDLKLDKAGQGVMIALPTERTDMEDDPQLRS
jgi:tellurite resistance protein